MSRWFALAFLVAVFGSCCAPGATADDLGLRVPEGFDVSLFADDTLAHDIYSMTVDAQGRVVVAGAGYVKTLHDSDGDGRADRATLFSPLPASGAHGMVFDGPDLICTGDNSVMRLRDADGDGVADGAPEVWTELRNPEHGANGLVRGPDGCYYLICGNDAGVGEKQITTDSSPVRHPRCGGVVRFSAEGKPLDVAAHGFRNPYDLDFDAAGHLLTVDSDGERDHHLPWYAPTRLFDIAPGMEHGWLLQGWTRGWNRPASFTDNVDRMVEIGRGSPTGVAAYRHRGFPAHYRGGVFSACWTLGRVYYFPLEPAGATCRSQLEVFLQTTGDVGFAPCDLAVGPQGELYVAIGGRRTLGSVFRVRWTGNKDAGEAPPAGSLTDVLSADQPLASWSRARWVPAAKVLGKAAFEQAIGDETLPSEQRVRAVEVLVELWGPLDAVQAAGWAQAADAATRARVAWALGRGAATLETRQTVARLTADAEPAVQRAAWEALATLGPIEADAEDQPAWSQGLASRERRVRAAAILAARQNGQASYRNFMSKVRLGAGASTLRLASVWIKLPDPSSAEYRAEFAAPDLLSIVELLTAPSADVATQLEAVRLLQIGLGDLSATKDQPEVYTGYVGNATANLDTTTREELVRHVAPLFPSSDAELNRELARLLGMLGANHPTLLPAVARQWTASSTVEDDLHYLIVASLLTGSRTPDVTAATAQALLGLHKKLEDLGQFTSRNWPDRVGEMFDELARRDPALAPSVVANRGFGHPAQALFVERLPKEMRQQGTRRLWAAVAVRGEEPTAELIALAGRQPAGEAVALLDAQWEHAGLRDSIVVALAKHPRPDDRAKFVEALASPQPDVVQKAAEALLALGIDNTPEEMAQALRALKQACALVKRTEPRGALVRLLEFWTEGSADVEERPDPTKYYEGWYEMFEQNYPSHAELLKSRADGAALKTWQQRLANVNWAASDATRGRGIFERRTCHRCHQVSGHLGPELKGAVSRMSREDLLTAIVDPNLEVSPAFQTTVIATNSGQVYHGVIVYESPESTLLQTGPDTTVRITNTEASSQRKSNQSLMPTGLLDPLSDGELGDLFAYLKTLGVK